MVVIDAANPVPRRATLEDCRRAVKPVIKEIDSGRAMQSIPPNYVLSLRYQENRKSQIFIEIDLRSGFFRNKNRISVF